MGERVTRYCAACCALTDNASGLCTSHEIEARTGEPTTVAWHDSREARMAHTAYQHGVTNAWTAVCLMISDGTITVDADGAERLSAAMLRVYEGERASR